jgi:putative membrane protein
VSEAEQDDHSAEHTAELELATVTTPLLAVRGAIGGGLMGLANLVPGVSGGTMLLAAGVYPGFIAAVAELSTLRFRLRSLVLLGAIAGTAAVAILLLAGLLKSLVVEQRWVMYSLFIGLTLGGVPLVWRLARPVTPTVFLAAGGAFAVMVLMQVTGSAGGGEASTGLLFVAGLAGASAMILPGVSGGYLLLLLGQYEPILGAIDLLKQGLLGANGSGFDLSLVLTSMRVVIPVGIGVVAGVVGVSNLLKWLLEHLEKPTLGVLLGLLFGAVVGLWPFQEPVEPRVGEVIGGRVVTEATLPAIELEDWPLRTFAPGTGQAAGALGLVALGFTATMLISRIGGDGRD